MTPHKIKTILSYHQSTLRNSRKYLAPPDSAMPIWRINTQNNIALSVFLIDHKRQLVQTSIYQNGACNMPAKKSINIVF